MSYQVLARKWRPRKFSEMAGQEHVLRALVNALDNDRLHHAYLFTGTRGVGKTSIARLFAKALNCEEGVSSTPCGVCTACREIAEGRFVDLIEVDAASRTKVEDTRELLENVQYAPSHGRYKVYLIDEVHMLSSSSFNALLKTLEEPPPHVKFLLATTDPQKLPVTVLSRCLQFNLKNLSPQRIVEHLHYVLTEEQLSFDEPALWLLARSADGSMRDALSLTDQAIAFGSGMVSEADVRTMLGTIDQRLVYQIMIALAQHDARGVMDAVQALSEFSPDYSSVLADLVSLLHRVALAQLLPDAIDNSLGDQQQVMELAALLRAEDIQLYYQIALMGRKDLPYAPDLREGLEMVLLRMLAFRPASLQVSTPAAEKPTTVTERPAGIDSTSNSPVETAATVTARSNQAEVVPPWDEAPPWTDDEVPSPVKKPEAAETPAAQYAEPAPEAAELVPPVVTPSLSSREMSAVSPEVVVDTPLVVPSAVVDEASEAVVPVSLTELTLTDWVRVAPLLALTGMTASICRNLSLESVDAETLSFHYPPEQGALLNSIQKERIQEALQVYFNASLEIRFVQAEQTHETPAQYSNRKKAERQAEAVISMQKDPMVQRIIEQFSAELDTASVRPID
ncbi:DNA polymerase III subunit gamma/tau [Nitrincola iocasae]|uniref:DNA polymerase III subunit gamma/tau n=1 Tax=Nitrincola iocasae TaxID=2614693 RepID=A0A5J6LG34_9GAMM|nr:DNA polymerase III subunit gamma/tau [Nitrincola iocasae]QEW07312.1 DNA polymerase III subunit gamma/tau [Nitrincola iocasae]